MFLLVVLAAALVPRRASARELDYRAPAGCPSEADVARSLEARAPSGRDARIDVSAEGAGFRGELVVGAGEHRLARSVQARTCAAVVDALTLVVVLDRESDVSVEDVPAAAPDESTSTSTSEPAPVGERSERQRHAYVGLGLAGTSFANGAVASGLQLSVEVDFGVPFARGIRATLLPYEKVGSSDDARPTFTRSGGALDYCPVAFLDSHGPRVAVMADACVRGEIASLHAIGPVKVGGERERLWTSAGAIGRARLSVGRAGVRPYVEANAGLLAPLARDRFHFEGAEPVRAPPVQWLLAVQLGLVIW